MINLDSINIIGYYHNDFLKGNNFSNPNRVLRIRIRFRSLAKKFQQSINIPSKKLSSIKLLTSIFVALLLHYSLRGFLIFFHIHPLFPLTLLLFCLIRVRTRILSRIFPSTEIFMHLIFGSYIIFIYNVYKFFC